MAAPNLDKVFNVAGAMVTLALVTVVISGAGDTAKVLSAIGEMFSGSLRAAMGPYAGR